MVSWNLHGAPGAPEIEARFARVARWILAPPGGGRPPDLVCFQEVWTGGQEEQLRAALGERYDLFGTPRGWLVRRGGLLALVRRGGELTCQGSHFREFAAEAPAWRIWEGDGFADKGVQRLELRLAGEALVVFHTHLQAGYPGAEHAQTRAAQLAELAQAMAQAPAAAPALALGDLNTEPDDLERLLLARDPRWRDLVAPLRERRECWSPPDSRGREKWIDYALGRDGASGLLRVLRRDCMPSRPADHPFSDHPGLDLELAIDLGPQARRLLPALLAARLAAPQTRREWLGALALLGLGTWLPAPAQRASWRASFAQPSRSPTLRESTSAPGRESGSTQK